MKRDKHDESEQKIKELNEKYLRALADYQNLEKRIISQRDESIKRGIAQIILEFLAVFDLLQKANKHLGDEGLGLAIRELEGLLERHGVSKIEVLGKKFDPVEMECVEVAESEKEDEVLEEMRAGYKMADMVVRPAQVKVGKSKVDQKDEELAKDQLQKGDYM